jgi:hypothetical protein
MVVLVTVSTLTLSITLTDVGRVWSLYQHIGSSIEAMRLKRTTTSVLTIVFVTVAVDTGT